MKIVPQVKVKIEKIHPLSYDLRDIALYTKRDISRSNVDNIIVEGIRAWLRIKGNCRGSMAPG